MEVVLAAGAVITDGEGRLLLVKRGREPHRGRWSVPGGRVEPGETLEEAVAREAHEETGLQVEVGRELWTVRMPTGDGREFEIHDFLTRPMAGVVRAGDDADAAAWVAPGDLHRLRLTTHLVSHLRRGGVLAPLPHVDEHAIEVAADREAVWRALERTVERAAPSWFATLSGSEDGARSGPRPLAEWSTVPGFHVIAAERPSRLALAGRHRFSDYELDFRLDELGAAGTRVRAETRAVFPGPLGAAYRTVLLRTPLHRFATRRLLSHVARSATRARSGQGR
jgi:acetyl-CoA carboxylase carboxyl transferase subunit beta